MKTVNTIVKILTAIVAVAGAVYLIATYGDKIVAWAKKMLAKCPCKCHVEDCADCECECECSCEGECKCDGECECECDGECECECTCEKEEAAEEAPAEDVIEEVVIEESAPVAEEADFAE